MKKLLTLIFLLCSIAILAEEEGQDLPVGKGECLSPFALFIPFFTPLVQLAFYLFIVGLIYVIAEITGKRNEDNKVLWIIISLVAGLVICPALVYVFKYITT